MTALRIDPTDLPYRLPADAYAYLVRTLADALPPPPDPSAETAALRKQSIIARISALRPNDAIEAEPRRRPHRRNSEQSRDAFRWIPIYRANGEHRLAMQCRAQGISLMREAKRTLREIQRLQTETRARHADPDATDTAERIEHVTMVMTAEAVERLPDPAPEPYVPQRAAPKVFVAKIRSRSPTKRKLRLHRDNPSVPAKAPPAALCSTRQRSRPAARAGTARCFSPTSPPKRPNHQETAAAAEAPPRTAPTAGK